MHHTDDNDNPQPPARTAQVDIRPAKPPTHRATNPPDRTPQKTHKNTHHKTPPQPPDQPDHHQVDLSDHSPQTPPNRPTAVDSISNKHPNHSNQTQKWIHGPGQARQTTTCGYQGGLPGPKTSSGLPAPQWIPPRQWILPQPPEPRPNPTQPPDIPPNHPWISNSSESKWIFTPQPQPRRTQARKRPPESQWIQQWDTTQRQHSGYKTPSGYPSGTNRPHRQETPQTRQPDKRDLSSDSRPPKTTRNPSPKQVDSLQWILQRHSRPPRTQASQQTQDQWIPDPKTPQKHPPPPPGDNRQPEPTRPEPKGIDHAQPPHSSKPQEKDTTPPTHSTHKEVHRDLPHPSQDTQQGTPRQTPTKPAPHPNQKPQSRRTKTSPMTHTPAQNTASSGIMIYNLPQVDDNHHRQPKPASPHSQGSSNPPNRATDPQTPSTQPTKTKNQNHQPRGSQQENPAPQHSGSPQWI